MTSGSFESAIGLRKVPLSRSHFTVSFVKSFVFLLEFSIYMKMG